MRLVMGVGASPLKTNCSRNADIKEQPITVMMGYSSIVKGGVCWKPRILFWTVL